MPRVIIRGMDEEVIEFTTYFEYEQEHRQVKFEGRMYFTIAQINRLGGLQRVQKIGEYLLYDTKHIYSFQWQRSISGFRRVPDHAPTKYGDYLIHDVYGNHIYRGSMKYVWKEGREN
jgi:hypothetical protein